VVLSVVYFILSFVCWIWVRKYIERINQLALLQYNAISSANLTIEKNISNITSKSANHTYAADPYIDAVISCFATLFKRNNVKFSCSILVIPIEKYQVELCLVFSNALQNALEASLNLPPEKRSVSVTAKIKFYYLVLQVANRYAGLLELADGALPPTIKDSTGHGYDLSSSKTTLESMGGVLNLRTDKNIFLLEATAKIN